MPTSTLNHQLAATPQAGEASLSAAGDCLLSAVYTDDQFVASTPRTLHRNHGSVMPAGVCLQQTICFFPVLRFTSTQTAIAVDEPEASFDSSGDELNYSGDDSYIVATFDLSAHELTSERQTGVARIMFEILAGPVAHEVATFRETSFPTLVSDLTVIPAALAPTSYNKKKWLEIDIKNEWKSAVDAAGSGTIDSLTIGFRFAGDASVSLSKLPILIIRLD